MWEYTNELEKNGKVKIAPFCRSRGIPRRTFYNIKSEFSKGSNFQRKPGSGAKTKFTPTKQEALKQFAKKNSYQFTWEAASEALKAAGDSSVGISYSQLAKRAKEAGWVYRKRRTQPLLSEGQEKARLEWCQEHVEDEFLTTVDYDESTFLGYVRNARQKLPPGKKSLPLRVFNKTHPPSIMVGCAIVRLSYLTHNKGTLILFRFAHKAFAIRKSKHHEKGDLIWRDDTVRWSNFRSCMTSKVIPQIRRTFVPEVNKVTIQLDNAPAHGVKKLSILEQEVNKGHALKIHFAPQPAKSPDLNMNDLGFFRALKRKVAAVNKGVVNSDTLFNIVHNGFLGFKTDTIEKLAQTKKNVVQEVIKANGKFLPSPPRSKK